jgi:hypothetical protein
MTIDECAVTHIFTDTGFQNNRNIFNCIDLIPKAIYVMYIFYITHICEGLLSQSYTTVAIFVFILVKSLVMGLLAETCCLSCD